MGSDDKIKSSLENIYNWKLVSNKKNLLKGIESAVKGDETILDLLDGFYNRDGNGNGREDQGILCVSDRKIFFVPGEKSKSGTDRIEYGDILKIDYIKGYSSIKITITLAGRTASFKSFVTESSARKFIGLIENRTGSGVVYSRDDSGKVLQGITDLFINRISIPGLLDRISDGREKAGDETVKKDIPPGDLVNLNYLFVEAKKIYSGLAPYLGEAFDGDFKMKLANDIIVLASLSSMADGSLSDDEILFMSMVLLPLNPGGRAGAAEKGRELFTFELFPPEFRDYCMEYWNSLSGLIKNAHIDSEKHALSSIVHLREYDRAHGTDHAAGAGNILFQFSESLMKADGEMNVKEEERLKQVRELIFGAEKEGEKAGDEKKAADEAETLESVMEKINALVGMDNIKEEIKTFINLIKVQKERKERGFPVTPFSLHAVFHGPPGTGKTTIARLLGKVYKCLGLLAKGHLIETDRAGVVAGYVGQTAIKVDEVVQKSLDGVLFIDEAYSLSPSDGGKDFGQEAIDAILKRMEDYRERLVVIVAGYPDEMKRFINSNPGLKSRFNRYFYFDHYRPEELMKIFDVFAKNVHFGVQDPAREKLLKLLGELYEARDKTFGNGRLVRNVFEKMVEKQANRIANITPLTDEVLCTITGDDIPDKGDVTVK